MLKSYTVAEDVKAFSTTRKGGVSQGKYGEFNINEYCGDSAVHVAENRQTLADELGIAPDHIILPHQVHGVEVCKIKADFLAMPERNRKMRLEGVDAVITDQAGICIGVSTADCIPVLLYDEEHHAVAAIHAGWRGTLARIVDKTLQEMNMTYQTDPRKLKAVIGPGISLANFEVGDEVYEAFEQARFPMEQIAKRYDKWHIDLPLSNRLILTHSGVPAENIHDCGICTFAHSDEFFSARKLGIESGRIYTAIMLEKQR